MLVVAEHGTVAVLPDEKEVGCPQSLGQADPTQLPVVVDAAEIQIEAAGQTCDQVLSQIVGGEGVLFGRLH